MRLVLLGQFKFDVELFRCETCCGQLVGEAHIPYHAGHKWRPCYHILPFDIPRVLWYLASGKLGPSKKGALE